MRGDGRRARHVFGCGHSVGGFGGVKWSGGVMRGEAGIKQTEGGEGGREGGRKDES